MITFEQVTKRYGGRLALDSVSWHMDEGECVVFAGHSGSGKTTLLRLITHEIAPTSGSVTVGTLRVISEGWTKMAVPTIVPTTSAVACTSPKTRVSSRRPPGAEDGDIAASVREGAHRWTRRRTHGPHSTCGASSQRRPSHRPW